MRCLVKKTLVLRFIEMHGKIAEIAALPRRISPMTALRLVPLLLVFTLLATFYAPACRPDGVSAAEADAEAARIDPLMHAENLLDAARAGRLDSAIAAEAAELLDHGDPFVRGIAEWALATKVNEENNGQVALWPGEKPPLWFAKWARLDGEVLLECDYVRQAFVWSIHRDKKRLLESVDKIQRRAQGAASEVQAAEAPPERLAIVDRQLERLQQIRDQLATQVASGGADLAACRLKPAKN